MCVETRANYCDYQEVLKNIYYCLLIFRRGTNQTAGIAMTLAVGFVKPLALYAAPGPPRQRTWSCNGTTEHSLKNIYSLFLFKK